MKVLPAVTRRILPAVIAALTLSLAVQALVAQSRSPTWSKNDTLRIAKEVQRRLASLSSLRGFRLAEPSASVAKRSFSKATPLVRL